MRKIMELILKSTVTKDKFIINGCGKFNESRKSLTKAEASYLYIELHKWLFENPPKEAKNRRKHIK